MELEPFKRPSTNGATKLTQILTCHIKDFKTRVVRCHNCQHDVQIQFTYHLNINITEGLAFTVKECICDWCYKEQLRKKNFELIQENQELATENAKLASHYDVIKMCEEFNLH